MATFARVNGGAQAGEFVGRDLKFVKVALTGIHTSYTAVDSNFEKCVRVLSKYCTVTIVGTPASGVALFVVEGLPTKVGDSTADQSAGTAIATALATDADAATSGSTTWTVYSGLSGDTFA
jgi:hypothetical protein